MKAKDLWGKYLMGVVLPLAVLLATPAQAVIITTGCMNTNVSCTLAELTGGGTVQVDDKLFDQWRAPENTVSGTVSGRAAFDLTNIDVIPWPPFGTNDPGPGLEFVSLLDELSITQLATTPTASGDLDFVFRVSVINMGQDCFPNCIIDNTLQAFFDGNVDGECLPGQCDNFAEVRERLFLDAALEDPVLDVSGAAIEKDVHWEEDQSVGVFDDQSGEVVRRDFQRPPAPLFELWVLKDLTLLTGNTDEFVAITRFNQHFSQVPEPTTLALLGMGLAGLAFGRRRKHT